MNDFTRRRFLRQTTALAVLSPGLALKGAADTPPAVDSPKPPVPGPYDDAKLIMGAPPLPEEEAFTIVALPDTQNYSEKYPEIYEAQTRWIVEQQKARNIACVLHLGDITNQNTPEQWENAARAMKILDGKVPYFMAPGNHDYGQKGNAADRTTHLNTYFPLSSFQGRPTFGGVYPAEPDRMDNSYHLFSAGGRDFLVLCLEFGPRRDVVRWANGIVKQHAAREAILVTHVFMYDDDTRYDWAKYGDKQTWNPHDYGMAKASGGDVLDGEELWRELVSPNSNFIFTINGHVLHDGLGRLSSAARGDREVLQMLVNFQMRPNGGDGWLRLIEMRPDRTMHICDYSPTRNERNESAQNKFSSTVAPVLTL